MVVKLSESDKNLLLSWGYTKEDFPQIEEAMQADKTSYTLYQGDSTTGKRISSKQAISILGRRAYLAGISRSAFHWDACKEYKHGEILFDSSRLFRQNR